MPPDSWCVRMGLPDDCPLDFATRLLEADTRLNTFAWCGRQIPDGEMAFSSAAHAAYAVWSMNGIKLCNGCATRLAALLSESAATER